MTSALRRVPGPRLFLGDNETWLVVLVLVVLVALAVYFYRRR